MKKLLFLFCLSILSTSLFAQSKFEKVMRTAIDDLYASETVEDYQKVINKFEVIGMKEKSEWFPRYYHSLATIFMCFNEGVGSEDKDMYLNGILDEIEVLKKEYPEEAEIFALEAMYNVGKLVVDPMTRGMEYGLKVGKSCETALAIDPNNPRAKYVKLSNDMGAAQFFGSDLTAYCNKAKELLEVWDDFELKSEIHPIWGKIQVIEISKKCD